MFFTDLYKKLITENTAIRSYGCLMLNSAPLQQQIAKLQEGICPCEVYDEEPGHGLETEAHITCLYGFHEQQPYRIFNKIDLKPCKYKLTGISIFSNPKYDVLKFDVSSTDLHALNKELCEKFEYTSSFPDYHPHMTIAYLKSGTGKFYCKYLECDELINKEFTSNEFIFSDALGNKTIKRII